MTAKQAKCIWQNVLSSQVLKANSHPLIANCSFLVVATLLCALALLLDPPQLLAQSAEPWFRRALVGMEVGPTGAHFGYSDPTDARYCEKWSGGEIVRKCVEANAEYLVLWLRDGDYAYYNSRLLTKAPGLGERDPLREAVQEAKKHRLPLISYCVVQQGGLFLEEHPEWRMRDSAGKPIGRFCYNSGYLDAMKQIVSEQIAYGIDGFHIDMLDQGFGKPYGCWCDSCRKSFRQQFGHEMPDGATWDGSWDDMLKFRYQTSEAFEKRLTAWIKSISPRLTVDYNYHGSPPFSFEVGQRPVQHALNADFVTGETGLWGFSALGVALNAEFYRASTPGVPYQVAIQRGVRMYHDQTTRPLNDMRWETLTLLAHGAFVTMIDKTAFDGGLDQVAYERIGELLSEARQKRKHFGHKPLHDIGLYFSSRTRDWVAREEPARYFQSFQGAHQACAMEHLQFGVLLDENCSLETLQRFPAVCLPNVGILSDREVEMLTEYVTAGGGLLVTGQTGQFGPRGEPLGASRLAKLTGARLKSQLDSKDNWISFSADESHPSISEDLRRDWPFLVEGPASVYEPTTAQAWGTLYRPHRTKRQLQGRMHTNWPMSADEAVGPAVLVNRVGRGTVVTCAASPDYAVASEHGLVEDRILFRNMFRTLRTQPRVQIEAPANVEAVVTDEASAGRLRVHLLAYNPTPRTTPSNNRPFVLPGMIEDKPLFRVTVRVRSPIRRLRALNSDTRLEQTDTEVQATIEDVHEVLLIEY